MPSTKLTAWLMGMFAVLIVGLVGWVGNSLSLMQAQIPLIAYRLSAVENQLSALNDANRAGARFTAQDGIDLAELVRRLEARVIAVENRLPGGRVPAMEAAKGQGG